MAKVINSGATCPKCRTKSINYAINGGNYVYTCVNCDEVINEADLVVENIKQDQPAEIPQDVLSKFVDNNVIACQSHLVDELIAHQFEGFSGEDIENYYHFPCLDCGEPMEELEKDEFGDVYYRCNSCGNDIKESVGSFEPKEVLEWWLVNEWLYRKLREEGEVVIDNGFCRWWGRTCSGQAIHLDGVIEDIYRKIQ